MRKYCGVAAAPVPREAQQSARACSAAAERAALGAAEQSGPLASIYRSRRAIARLPAGARGARPVYQVRRRADSLSEAVAASSFLRTERKRAATRRLEEAAQVRITWRGA